MYEQSASSKAVEATQSHIGANNHAKALSPGEINDGLNGVADVDLRHADDVHLRYSAFVMYKSIHALKKHLALNFQI